MQPLPSLNDLYTIGTVADRTRTTLAQLFVDHDLDRRSYETLDLTLAHLGDVREGFILSLRATGRGAELRELAELVRATLATLDTGWLDELGLELLTDETIHLPHLQLLAFAHSYLVLGLLPRMPRQWVTFPQPRSYADIPVPRRPGELLERIEELEAVVARIQTAETTFSGDSLRRTYGFFEASAWLVRDQLRLFRRPPTTQQGGGPDGPPSSPPAPTP